MPSESLLTSLAEKVRTRLTSKQVDTAPDPSGPSKLSLLMRPAILLTLTLHDTLRKSYKRLERIRDEPHTRALVAKDPELQQSADLLLQMIRMGLSRMENLEPDLREVFDAKYPLTERDNLLRLWDNYLVSVNAALEELLNHPGYIFFGRSKLNQDRVNQELALQNLIKALRRNPVESPPIDPEPVGTL